jgi:hypothetical protein
MLSLPKASTSGLPVLKSPRGLPDMTTAPNGELRRQDFHLQVQQLVSLRSLPWVPWASVPHLPRYYAPLRLPHCPSQVASLVARSPIPCPLRCVRVVPDGLMIWSKSPDHTRAFGHPVPQSGSLTRRQVALPSSRATPMKTCPALRPRWCPDCSPLRLPDCCLPAGGNRRLSPPDNLEGYPCVHNDILFGAPSRGLSSRVPSSFVRPLLGVHVESAAGLLARLWPGRT